MKNIYHFCSQQLLLFFLVCLSAILQGQTAFIANANDNTVSVISQVPDQSVATVPTGDTPNGVAFSPDGLTAYVTNQEEHTVSVINATDNTVVATIPVEQGPSGIVVSHNGERLYVANQYSGNVSVINTADNSLVTNINTTMNPFGSGRPYALALSPDGEKLFVTNLTAYSFGVISTATDSLLTSVNTGTSSFGIAVTPDGSKVLLTGFDDKVFLTYSAIDYTYLTSLYLDFIPRTVAISPDGQRAFLAAADLPIVGVIDLVQNEMDTFVIVDDGLYDIKLSPCGLRAYVTNQYDDHVTVINTTTYEALTTVPVGEFPAGMAVSPDGTKIIVANEYSDDASIIRTAFNSVTETIPVDTTPIGVAVSPDALRVYVANSGSDHVSVISTIDNTVVDSVNVGDGTFGITASPDGSKVYVTHPTSQTVSVINTTDNTVAATVDVGQQPSGIIVTPDGSRVYVANQGSANVSVISTTDNMVIATIDAGAQVLGLSVTPDGAKVYVTTQMNGVLIIDTSNNTVLGTIGIDNPSTGLAITPDGAKAYVANSISGIVSVINASEDTLITAITVGTFPNGVAVSPDGQLVYVANTSDNNVSIISTALDKVLATVDVGGGPISYGNFVLGNPAEFSLAPFSICEGIGYVLDSLGGGSPTGGVYSGNGVTDDGNGLTFSFDPAAAGVGEQTITYTVGPFSATTKIRVEWTPFVSLPDRTFSLFEGIQTVYGGGSPFGGTYIGPGVTDDGDGQYFTFDPMAAGLGIHTLRYAIDYFGCIDTATATITVVDDFCPFSMDISLNGGVDSIVVGTGDMIMANGIFNISNQVSCPGYCEQQIIIGVEDVPIECVYDGLPAICPNVTNGSYNINFNAPLTPGTFNIYANNLFNFYCDTFDYSGAASDGALLLGKIIVIDGVLLTAADYCVDAGIQDSLSGGLPAGGIYAGPGITDHGNGMTYSFDPAMAGPGVHAITYTVGQESTTAEINVFDLPMVSLSLPDTLVMTDIMPQMGIGGGLPAGGVYASQTNGMEDDGNGATFSFNEDVMLNSDYEITYTFTDANGCTNYTSQSVFVMEMPNAVIEIDKTNIKLFPNPTAGEVWLTGVRANQIEAFNSMGRLVLAAEQPGNIINISDVPAGIYFLKIQANAGVYSARVVKN